MASVFSLMQQVLIFAAQFNDRSQKLLVFFLFVG